MRPTEFPNGTQIAGQGALRSGRCSGSCSRRRHFCRHLIVWTIQIAPKLEHIMSMWASKGKFTLGPCGNHTWMMMQRESSRLRMWAWACKTLANTQNANKNAKRQHLYGIFRIEIVLSASCRWGEYVREEEGLIFRFSEGIWGREPTKERVFRQLFILHESSWNSIGALPETQAPSKNLYHGLNKLCCQAVKESRV